MKRRPTAWLGWTWVTMCIFALGCGSAAPRDPAPTAERTDTSRDAILNAVAAPTSDLPTDGVVWINVTYRDGGVSTCTGVLLTDRWVLTAGHCFCAAQVNTPNTVQLGVYGNVAKSQDPTSAAVYTTTAAKIIKHPTTDAALVQLQTTLPFLVPPLVYTGNGSDLPGQSATLWGFGATAIANGGPDFSTLISNLESALEDISSNQTSAAGLSYTCGPDRARPGFRRRGRGRADTWGPISKRRSPRRKKVTRAARSFSQATTASGSSSGSCRATRRGRRASSTTTTSACGRFAIGSVRTSLTRRSTRNAPSRCRAASGRSPRPSGRDRTARSTSAP